MSAIDEILATIRRLPVQERLKSPVVTAKAATYLTQQGCFTTSALSVAEIVYGFRRVGREDGVAQFVDNWRAT